MPMEAVPMGDDPALAPIDPREFCLLLKQVDREPPRLSRDMEPDLIGIGIKQRILDALLAAPPAAADFAPALLECASALDLPPGVARGVCSDILLEWRMAHSSPAFMAWLRAEATRPPEPRRKRRTERDGEPAWRPRPERGFGGPTEQQ
jgi:hypothetical protein